MKRIEKHWKYGLIEQGITTHWQVFKSIGTYKNSKTKWQILCSNESTENKWKLLKRIETYWKDSKVLERIENNRFCLNDTYWKVFGNMENKYWQVMVSIAKVLGCAKNIWKA